jgi:predicted transcriptional regulator
VPTSTLYLVLKKQNYRLEEIQGNIGYIPTLELKQNTKFGCLIKVFGRMDKY